MLGRRDDVLKADGERLFLPMHDRHLSYYVLRTETARVCIKTTMSRYIMNIVYSEVQRSSLYTKSLRDVATTVATLPQKGKKTTGNETQTG